MLAQINILLWLSMTQSMDMLLIIAKPIWRVGVWDGVELVPFVLPT